MLLSRYFRVDECQPPQSRRPADAGQNNRPHYGTSRRQSKVCPHSAADNGQPTQVPIPLPCSSSLWMPDVLQCFRISFSSRGLAELKFCQVRSSCGAQSAGGARSWEKSQCRGPEHSAWGMQAPPAPGSGRQSHQLSHRQPAFAIGLCRPLWPELRC